MYGMMIYMYICTHGIRILRMYVWNVCMVCMYGVYGMYVYINVCTVYVCMYKEGKYLTSPLSSVTDTSTPTKGGLLGKGAAGEVDSYTTITVCM